MGKWISLRAADGATFDAWQEDAVGKRRGGLVLIMEIFGVTQHIRDLCGQWAKEGYEVVAPQLYDRIEKKVETGYGPDDVKRAIGLRAKNPIENPVMDVAACYQYLAPSGKVGVLGFCYGGSVTWVSACRVKGLAAASGYYGGQIKDHITETPMCPTILHFGERDKGIPMDGVRAVEKAHPDVKVYVYDADHGFVSDRPTHHDAKATALARERTLALFRKHVG